jgi:3-phenylpropionate/trans-cinnamate dioxygenase ferredoxin reductase component
MQQFDYVVIGAGPAGGAAAIELVRSGEAGTVAIIGSESYAPYERPPLSKRTLMEAKDNPAPDYLFGDIDAIREAGITPFIPDSATSVDVQSKVVELVSGSRLGFRRLLFATGAEPRRLMVPGSSLAGIHYLRTFDDARRLAGDIRPGASLVVVGGGFIGLEVAATARTAGARVSVVEANDRLLSRGMPDPISNAVARKFEAEGVILALNRSVRAFHGTSRVESVELDDGTVMEAGTVVIGIGAVPNDALATAAGIRTDNGITTDITGQTSDPDCFAVGDVACSSQGLLDHPTHRRRLEAWEPAIEQAIATAKVMLGEAHKPPQRPWIWSDQFDWNLQVVGHGELADTTVVRRGSDDESMIVFQLCRGKLIGAVTLNEGRSMAMLRRAVANAPSVGEAALRDTRVPLRRALLE